MTGWKDRLRRVGAWAWKTTTATIWFSVGFVCGGLLMVLAFVLYVTWSCR